MTSSSEAMLAALDQRIAADIEAWHRQMTLRRDFKIKLNLGHRPATTHSENWGISSVSTGRKR